MELTASGNDMRPFGWAIVVSCCLQLGCGPDAAPDRSASGAELIPAPIEDSQLTFTLASRQREFLEAVGTPDASLQAFLAPGFRITNGADSTRSIGGPFSPDARSSNLRLLAGRLPADQLMAVRFEVLPLADQAAAVVTFSETGRPSVTTWTNWNGAWKITRLTLNVADESLKHWRRLSSERMHR